MAEYSKKTVAELQDILKSRALPISGKKADLIARLTEADKAAETTEVAEPASNVESTSVQPENVEPVQEEVTTAPEEDVQVTNQTAAEPSEAPAEVDAAATEEAKLFALNLAASDVDNEMAKRQARAERFKTGGQADADAEVTETATADTDALKNLERAKRFGGGTTAIGKLDEALPSERERGPRGRKNIEGNSAMDDPGLKKNFNRNGRSVNRRRGGPGKPTGIGKPSGSGFSNDRDRDAAEARKKRFAGQ